MKEYLFDNSSPFFNEIVTYSLPFIGTIALVRFPELKEQVSQLVSRHNIARTGFQFLKSTIPNIVIPNQTAIIGNVVSCTLLESQKFANEVQSGTSISGLRYVDENTLENEPGFHEEKPLPPSVMSPVAQVTIGSAYERVQDHIKIKWGDDPWAWPSLLQYFRHCRNAAFHGNRFDIRGYGKRPGIDSANPPTWRTSTMPDDVTMHGKSLIRDWLEIGDIPILLGDVEGYL